MLEHEFRFRQQAEMTQAERLELLLTMGNPREVFYNLETINVMGFNNISARQWSIDILKSMEQSLIVPRGNKFNDSPHIILLVGSPGTGKTTIATGLASQWTRGDRWDDNDKLKDKFPSRHIHHYWGEWGDAFPVIGGMRPDLRVQETEEYINPNLSQEEEQKLRERKQKEITVATKIMEVSLVHFLQKYYYPKDGYEKKGGHILYIDCPGARMFEEYTQMLHELYHHSGPFAGLPYQIHVAGIVASPDLLALNREKRPKTREDMDADPLTKETMLAASNEERDAHIARYIQGSATQSEIRMFELEQLYIMRKVLESKKFAPDYIERRIASYHTPEYPNLFAQDVALALLPYALRSIVGKDTEQVPIFLNAKHLDFRHSTLINRRLLEELQALGAYNIPELQQS